MSNSPILRGWLLFQTIILLGYALLGRKFAYLGIGKAYIGEICLMAGVVWLGTFRKWPALLRNKSILAILVLQTWGAACTLPYVDKYGLNAFRDAVLWGYSFYAIVIAAAILSAPCVLSLFLSRYRLFTGVFLWCAPVLWCIFSLFFSRIPVGPEAGVPILSLRSSETLVQLAGVFSFFAAGLGGQLSIIRAVLLVLTAGMAGSTNRGGLLACIVSASLALVLAGVKRTHLLCVGIAGILLTLGLLCNLELPVSYEGRPISTQQLMVNLASMFTTTATGGDLEYNKQWRLNWWHDIVNYTVNGPYFLTGKGYGVNLADDDGYQVQDDGSLRNPHNSHLTFLARSGVPGLALWIGMQSMWFAQMLRSYFKAKRSGSAEWVGLFLFLMCFWLAFMVNMAFDPALEGPMLGIWFWSVIGTGIGAVVVYREPSEQGCLRRA